MRDPIHTRPEGPPASSVRGVGPAVLAQHLPSKRRPGPAVVAVRPEDVPESAR